MALRLSPTHDDCAVSIIGAFDLNVIYFVEDVD